MFFNSIDANTVRAMAEVVNDKLTEKATEDDQH